MSRFPISTRGIPRRLAFEPGCVSAAANEVEEEAPPLPPPGVHLCSHLRANFRQAPGMFQRLPPGTSTLSFVPVCCSSSLASVQQCVFCVFC